MNAAYFQKAKISPTTHVQLLQWLHGKQQQQHLPEEALSNASALGPEGLQ